MSLSPTLQLKLLKIHGKEIFSEFVIISSFKTGGPKYFSKTVSKYLETCRPGIYRCDFKNIGGVRFFRLVDLRKKILLRKTIYRQNSDSLKTFPHLLDLMENCRSLRSSEIRKLSKQLPDCENRIKIFVGTSISSHLTCSTTFSFENLKISTP